MKVCDRCSGPHEGSRDGDNTCKECREKPFRKTKELRKQREAVLRSLGLVKFRGTLGGVYWE